MLIMAGIYNNDKFACVQNKINEITTKLSEITRILDLLQTESNSLRRKE